MKLKYYLRGLGIGIAVTAFIMSHNVKKEELTDAQIKMRALELGMVEETVLADLPQAAVEDSEEKTKEKKKEGINDSDFEYSAGEAEIMEQDEGETLEPGDLEESESIDVEGEMKTGEEKTQQSINTSATEENRETLPQNIETSANGAVKEEIVENYIVIAVEPGNGSETVSRKLYNAGLVESAVQFNRFLMNNGYDIKLIVGNHEIPVGASEEDMAKILCGMQ